METFLRGNFQSLDYFKRTLPYSNGYDNLSSVALVILCPAKYRNLLSFHLNGENAVWFLGVFGMAPLPGKFVCWDSGVIYL